MWGVQTTSRAPVPNIFRRTEMRCLVIGYGSIGARHARLLTELGCDTAVVSARPVPFPIRFSDFSTAVREYNPDYVVIANATAHHRETVSALAATGYFGRVLVEKPLFDRLESLVDARFSRLCVGYNLRFHPVLQRLHGLLAGEAILSVQAYVGQYLPDWRPGTDYRNSYSAYAASGGGVLRDLSHELDYLMWLFGDWSAVAALGGRVSCLEIDSDDIFVILMRMARCPVVSVQMSYLDRVARRRIVVNTATCTIEADLVAETLRVDGVLEHLPSHRDQTYLAMHQAMLGDGASDLCRAEDGMATLNLIDAAERANRNQEWIVR